MNPVILGALLKQARPDSYFRKSPPAVGFQNILTLAFVWAGCEDTALTAIHEP
jgi:hypothetical protein